MLGCTEQLDPAPQMQFAMAALRRSSPRLQDRPAPNGDYSPGAAPFNTGRHSGLAASRTSEAQCSSPPPHARAQQSVDAAAAAHGASPCARAVGGSGSQRSPTLHTHVWGSSQGSTLVSSSSGGRGAKPALHSSQVHAGASTLPYRCCFPPSWSALLHTIHTNVDGESSHIAS